MTPRPEAGTAYCPSSNPGEPGATLLGVLSGTPTRPVVAYLTEPVPVDDELLAGIGDSAGEVLRVAAPCRQNTCSHFRDSACTLVAKLVRAGRPPEQDGLPRCHLRNRCLWWRQEGAPACGRCPLVTTDDITADRMLARVADPTRVDP